MTRGEFTLRCERFVGFKSDVLQRRTSVRMVRYKLVIFRRMVSSSGQPNSISKSGVRSIEEEFRIYTLGMTILLKTK